MEEVAKKHAPQIEDIHCEKSHQETMGIYVLTACISIIMDVRGINIRCEASLIQNGRF